MEIDYQRNVTSKANENEQMMSWKVVELIINEGCVSINEWMDMARTQYVIFN